MKRVCKALIVDLPDFAEGRLDASRAAEIKNHLTECAECQSEYEDVKNALSALRAEEPLRAPGDAYWNTFGPRLHEKIDALNSRARRIPAWVVRYLIPGAAVAAALLVVIRTGVFVRDSSEETLRSLVGQLSAEEKLALLNESVTAPQEAIAEYIVSDSVISSFRNELKANVREGTIDEYMLVPFDQQYTPEVLIESLSPDEAEQVFSKLEANKSITS